MRETGWALSRGAMRLGTAWARVNGVTAVRAQNLRLRPARLSIHPIVRRMIESAGVDLDL